MKKKLYTLILGCLLGLTALAQEQKIGMEEFRELYRTENAVILYKTVDCIRPSVGIDKREIYLKMINLTSSPIEITWQKELKYGDQCHNCDGENEELHFVTSIAANGSVEPNCHSSEYKDLRIFVEFLNLENKVKLSDFRIKEIKEILK